MNGADLKARFKAPRRKVAILLDGDLLAEHEAVSAELADVMAARTSLAGGAGADELARRVQDLESQMREATVTFELVGIGNNAYRALVAEHTKGDEGLSMVTFAPALVAACLRSPADVDVAWVFDSLNQGQVDELVSAAINACVDSDKVPFNQLASAQTRG